MSRHFDSSKAREAKPCLSLCPGALIRAVARVFDVGRRKPGRAAGGWYDRLTEDNAAEALDQFTDALFRHVLELAPGGKPDVSARDPETGEFVVAHVAANCAMILGALEKFPACEAHVYGRQEAGNPFAGLCDCEPPTWAPCPDCGAGA